MLRRSLCPAKWMPNISFVSRSCQLAPAYTGTHVGTLRSSSGTSALIVTPTCSAVLYARANTWKRVSPPV